VFWLFQHENGEWNVRREGDLEDRSYPDRESALKDLRLAAARCMAYCLFLQDTGGQFERECFNRLPPQSRRD
jgi:hypothetical protein